MAGGRHECGGRVVLQRCGMAASTDPPKGKSGVADRAGLRDRGAGSPGQAGVASQFPTA